MSLDGDVRAYERERLEELSQRPNTTVFTPSHDQQREPWKSSRLRGVMESLAERVTTFEASASDFAVRKACLDDAEILAFQREHPKFYHLLTDRAMYKDPRFRNAVRSMLGVREQVESGAVAEGQEADARATSAVVQALQ